MRYRSVSQPAPLVLAAMVALLFPTTTDVSAGSNFASFTLSDQPGITCPNSQNESACSNLTLEPQIRSDRAGNLYASSEHGIGGGTSAFKSTDGGLHFTTLPSPNALSAANTQFSPAGGDTDLATAPASNASGISNVYVASLDLANIVVSTSKDGGNSWSINPTGGTISGDDREWIAADGASKVCISYHDVITFNMDVNCSYDAGTTFTQLGSAFDADHLFLLENNASGNLVIDPSTHVVFQVFSGLANATEVLCTTCGYHVVYIAVSTDGGQTFTDHVVYNNPNPSVSYGHQFIQMSIDAAGNLYVLYSDNHNLFYSFSTDQGMAWSAPVQINKGPASATAIMPWSVAGKAGALDVVWYGTSYYDGVNPPDNYPATAAWYVFFAQNLKALSNHHFSQVRVTPVIHYGGVCEVGISCTGNRDLFDDFGIAASRTGLATIIYTDDQYRMPDSNNANYASCGPAQSNSIDCDHVAIARQTSGKGIY
jgi:hypothetical protein